MNRTCPTCKQVWQTAPRSSADHRRFFGVLAAVFHHWPEGHEFQPDDAEHLRKWLLIKAGYRDVTMVPIETDAPAVMRAIVPIVEGAVRAANGHAFIKPHGHGIAVFRAKSIAWDKLDQKAFNRVRDAVQEVIRAETGLEPETLLKEVEQAA